MAGRVIVKGSFTNVSASARFIAALTASIASSPLADDEGRYYAVAGGEILSQPVQGTFDAATLTWTVAVVPVEGVIYRISAPGFMPDCFVDSTAFLPMPANADVEVDADTLIGPPGGDTLVEYVTLTTVIASIDSKVATAVDEYFVAHPPAGGGGVTDHGALTGLDNDDHLIYLTAARGDARYAAGNDPRLANPRTPTAHAASHAAEGSDALTLTAAQLSDLTETVQDIVGALIVAGSGVTVSYNDTAGTFTINSTAGGGSTDPEVVRDVIGAAMVAGSGIQLTVNDAGDTITVASTAVLPTRQVVAGTGLSGGGDLSADRTLAVVYGTAAGTAAQGNDSRLSDARTPSGAAGGDLSGTYPNPGVAKVAGVTPSVIGLDLLAAEDEDVLRYLVAGNPAGPIPTFLGAVDAAGARSAIGAADAASLAAVATAGTYASLTGTVPTSALPPLAINTVMVVASQAAMLALTAERGDMAIRSDNGRTYVLASDSPATLADWKEVLAAGQVASVAGRTGVVVLTATDISDSTAAGRALLTAADVAAQRTLLGMTAEPTYVIATAETANTTVTAANVAGLAISGLPAGLYEIDVIVRAQSAAIATGAQIGMTWAGAGVTFTIRGLGANTDAAAPTWATPDDADTSFQLASGNAPAANSPFLGASISGMMRVAAGGMTGTVYVTLASELAGSQVKALPDSFIKYRRIAA